MEISQQDFSGGINQLASETQLAANEYRLLINARKRFGDITANGKAELQTLPRTGNNQGAVTFGNFIIVFVDGRAYYKVNGAWVRIADFLMDATARKLWTCSVPKSTRDYVRKLNGSANNPIVINANVNIAGNPAGIVVQDGLNQPWLIEFNAVAQSFVARQLHTYSQWSNTSATANDREYVPIGKQMFFLNQKLYVVAPDGKSLYQSVTGRPLDFVLNVDANGNKLISEALGGATSTSFNFDSDEITCVKDVNLTDTFLYATRFNVRLITLDYTLTLFGEPTYRVAQRIEAGILNEESLVDVLGDLTFIDADGIKSFNAVINYRVEGRNSIFSKQIAKILGGRVQKATQSASVAFDNYALYYCSSAYGKCIAVYDMLWQQWVAIDLTDAVDVKQFLNFDNGTVNELYAVTSGGLYKLYSSATKEMAQLYMGSLMPSDAKKEHKGNLVQPVFRGATQDGDLIVLEYVDEQLSNRQPRNISESVQAMVWPLTFPIGFNSKPNARNNVVIFDKGLTGKKLAYIIQWNTDAALQAVNVVTSEVLPTAATRQGATS